MNRDIRFNRERFLKGNSYYAKKGISAQTSQILVEAEITNKDVVRFDLTKEIKKIYERTLKRNDLFVVRAIGVALRFTGGKGESPLYSYPVQHIPGNSNRPGVAGFVQSSDSFRFYDGYLTLKTGQVTNFSSFPMLNFLHIPTLQPAYVSDGGGKMMSNGIVPACNPNDFMYELPEELVLAGTQDHKIQIDFPQNSHDLSFQDSYGNAATLYATLIFQGWLYEGATGQEYKDDPNNPYRYSI